MIINLKGKVNENDIEFEFAQIYFCQQQFVHVNQLFIKWKRKVDNIHGEITSSLIDKSPVNPNQQLVFFHQNGKSDSFLFTPTHLAKYKIQCPSFQSSVFNLHLSEKHEIENIFLQLEITNERLQ